MDLGTCLRNKSMRVRVLPSVLFERLRSSDGTRASLYESEGREFESRRSLCFVGLVGYDSGPVNRQRRFESGTELSGMGLELTVSGF